MKTIAVPVEPTEEMIAAMYDIHPCGPTDKLTRAYKAALAAAPPQPEPADHLAAPDSLERARNALRAITDAGSIGQAKRIAMQALGDGDQNDAPAAPASALPLSAEEINAMRGLLGANTLCDQALRAIELEQQVANEQARSRTLVNAAVFATERAEKAEAGLAELRKDAATIASMIQNVIVERRVK